MRSYRVNHRDITVYEIYEPRPANATAVIRDDKTIFFVDCVKGVCSATNTSVMEEAARRHIRLKIGAHGDFQLCLSA